MFIHVSRPKIQIKKNTGRIQDQPAYHAARSAYRSFSHRYPHWSESMFDWYFLDTYLRNRPEGQTAFEVDGLVKSYLAQFETGGTHKPEYVEELKQAVADFIEMYQEAAARS